MTWLKGGPYYELSFLLRNTEPKSKLAKNVMELLHQLNFDFKIISNLVEVEKKVDLFEIGEKNDDIIYRSFEINVEFDISGKRKSRLFIEELSDELSKLSFCFFGALQDAPEWDQIGIKNVDKVAFRRLFECIVKNINPILGTIAYDEDCSALFELEETFPNKKYSLKELSIEKIYKKINNTINEFEFCWINGKEFDESSDIEFEIQTI